MGSIQRVAQFADERSGAIKLRLEQNELKLSSSSTEAGESEDSIETPYNYDPLVVGFNSQYLIDFLRRSGTTVRYGWSSRTRRAQGRCGRRMAMRM